MADNYTSDKYVNPYTDFGFNKLFETAEIARFSPEQREEYEDSLKAYRDWKNTLDTAKQKSRAEGVAEGIEIGIEKGIAQGIKETAKRMLQKGLSIDDVCELTGLEKGVIEGLSAQK